MRVVASSPPGGGREKDGSVLKLIPANIIILHEKGNLCKVLHIIMVSFGLLLLFVLHKTVSAANKTLRSAEKKVWNIIIGIIMPYHLGQ